MIDRKWLKENAEKHIKSIQQRPSITIEQQGLLNVLNGTLTLLDDVEFIVEKYKLDEFRQDDTDVIGKAIEYLNWYFYEDDGTADKTAAQYYELLKKGR